MVNGALQQLKLISRDGQELKTIVRQFIENENKKIEPLEDTENKNFDLLIQTSLPKLRVRKKKKHFNELIEDDPFSDPYSKFKVEVYNVVMDGIVNSMQKRFIINSKIYTDLY